MSRTLHLVHWIALIFACFYIIYFIRAYQNELISFDEWVLEKQANYASEAAVDALLDSGHTYQDYNKGDYAVVDPDLAITEFSEIIGRDFGYTPTEETLQQIQQKYIKALLVCTYDGIYACWNMQQDNHNVKAFVCSPKIPYFYTDPKDGTQYVLNLGLEKGYKDSGSASDYSMSPYDYISLPKDVQLTAINNQVSNVLNYALVQAYGGGSNGVVFDIPALASQVTGAQIVDKVTVLGVIEGRATSFSTVVTAECVGGAQIIANDPILGVRIQEGKNRPLIPVYARASRWEWLLNNHYLDNITFDGEVHDIRYTPTKQFDTVFDAAKDGYNEYILGYEMR